MRTQPALKRTIAAICFLSFALPLLGAQKKLSRRDVRAYLSEAEKKLKEVIDEIPDGACDGKALKPFLRALLFVCEGHHTSVETLSDAMLGMRDAVRGLSAVGKDHGESILRLVAVAERDQERLAKLENETQRLRDEIRMLKKEMRSKK